MTRKSTAPEIGQIRAAPDMLPAAPFLNSLTGHGSTSATLQRPRFMRRVVHCHQRSQTTQSRPRNRGDSWIQISVPARAISRFPFWLPFWLTNCTQSGTPKWTRIRIAPGVLSCHMPCAFRRMQHRPYSSVRYGSWAWPWAGSPFSNLDSCSRMAVLLHVPHSRIGNNCQPIMWESLATSLRPGRGGREEDWA